VRQIVLVLTALVGCVAPADDSIGGGGGKADGNGTCDEPQYGDGTCHIDLACGIPDIDCYRFFDDDVAAARRLEELGDPVVPAADPLNAKARALVDETWAMFTSSYPLAKAADKHLAVVVTNDTSLQAYISYTFEPAVAYFSVQISSGLLNAKLSDVTLQGILFHELGHLVGHHGSDEVIERLRRFYVAPAGQEPIGATESDTATVRDAFTAWSKAVAFAGIHTDPQLAGLPYGGTLHQLINQYFATAPSSCSSQAARLRDLMMTPQVSMLDQRLVFSSDHLAARQAAIKALKDCTATVTTTFKDFRAMYAQHFANELTTVDVKFDTMRVFDGLVALSADRQAKVVAMESAFSTKAGRPWDALRYFSFEEQADDLSVRIAKDNGLPPDALAPFFTTFLANQASACETAIAAGTAPYGRDLLDPHHGNCWRIAHLRQRANTGATPLVVAPSANHPWIPTQPPTRLRSH
jgi:hypothetical protein